jgi:hypothetical protein
MQCGKCGHINPLDGTVGRKEVCLSCGADLRCCINCSHYDPGRYNSCAEPQAERVLDKDRRNFCDFFSAAAEARGKEKKTVGGDAKSRLDALFKK